MSNRRESSNGRSSASRERSEGSRSSMSKDRLEDTKSKDSPDEIVPEEVAVDDVAAVVVSNLAREVDRKLIAELFIQAGPVIEVDVENFPHGKIACVYYPSHESAQYAAAVMNGLQLHRRPIRVEAPTLKLEGSEYHQMNVNNGQSMAYEEMLQMEMGRVRGAPLMQPSPFGSPLMPNPIHQHAQGGIGLMGMNPMTNPSDAIMMGMNPMNPMFSPVPPMSMPPPGFHSSTPQSRHRRF